MKKISIYLLAVLLLATSMNLGNRRFNISAEEEEYITTDTFLSNNGKYDYEYIFGHLNVFSFGDTIASHIVGPIITQNNLSHSGSDIMPFSDIHNGTSSYIGYTSKGAFITNKFHLGVDKTAVTKMDIPRQYVGQKGNKIIKNLKENGDEYLLTSELYPNLKEIYLSGGTPNNGLFKNDNYINWVEAKNKLSNQSLKILTESRELLITEMIEGVVYVSPGENITIPSEMINTLEIISIVSPDPYNTKQITVSFSENLLGNDKYEMPRVYITDKAEEVGIPFSNQFYTKDASYVIDWFPGAGMFSDPNKAPVDKDAKLNIIFNFPYAKKIEDLGVIKPNGQWSEYQYLDSETVGHVLAPDADYYHSGNFYGGMIVNNLFSNGGEGHFWPHDYEAPVKPTDPKDPVVPGDKVEPNDPKDPVVPDDTVEPTDPKDPVVPGDKVDPTDPNDPVVPGDTVEPNDPNDPVVPGDKVEPTDPKDPVVPGDTVDPNNPKDPVVPDDTVDPTDPKDPVVPGDTVDPTDPKDPVVPGDTVDPTDPKEPVVPDDTVEPTDPKEPVVPGDTVEPTIPKEPVVPDDTIENIDPSEDDKYTLTPIEPGNDDSFDSSYEIIILGDKTPYNKTDVILPATGISSSTNMIGIMIIILGSTMVIKSKIKKETV